MKEMMTILKAVTQNNNSEPFMINIENMNVKDQSDIRSIARELEELRRLHALSHGMM